MEIDIKLSNEDLLCYMAKEYNLFFLAEDGSSNELSHLNNYTNAKRECIRRMRGET